MSESLYRLLKARLRDNFLLNETEQHYVNQVESLIGYEVKLHLPAGSIFILGADDAEALVQRVRAEI